MNELGMPSSAAMPMGVSVSVSVSDPSQVQLKKELTQIRKAARLLRDPGTTCSWRSPLPSSSPSAAARSVGATAAAAAAASTTWNSKSSSSKRVFLHNWKTSKPSSTNDNEEEEEEEEEEEDDDDDADADADYGEEDIDASSSAAALSVDDADSRSDTQTHSRSSSTILRRKYAHLLPPVKNANKTSKKTETHSHILSKYQHKQFILGRSFAGSRKSVPLRSGRDDFVDQSDDTEDYCHSEDPRRFSPLLSKLRRNKNSWSKFRTDSTSFPREDSSYSHSTPALSTSSYNRYGGGIRNPSTVGSWDGTTTSINDGDDEVDDHLGFPGRQGCGIPCYWSKRTPKHRGMYGSSCSPSFSDTLRRKGSSMLCGSQKIYPRRRQSSSGSNKQRIASRSAQGVLPLLTHNGDGRGGSSLGTGRRSDDDISTSFGELDLEALSRLDGRRWSSSCRSQQGLEIATLNGEGEGEEEGSPENIRSFSQKYKPMFFNELIGQNIVVQSLFNAIARGRIAPVYLFQGPRGTGKTSAARIFSASLNCLAPPDETKPCGYCRECSDFMSGKNKDLLEVDGTNKKGLDKVRYLLKTLSAVPPSPSSKYKVFVIDECHLLPSKTWLAFLKYLEEPPQRVVFIFITTDLDNVPRTIQSRCQKYLFNKIKDSDVVARLRKISAEENLDVDLDALELIAVNADGSLRDAETMLDQLSLLGKRISTSLVNELVGVVSDEKLLELLELAMSSDTAETVKRARDLMDSGVDPMVLMSQLASLIMDIIAGTYNVNDAKHDSFFGDRNLTEAELERLKHALKILSDAEKQLRVSSERSTWFTATLLQLGSVPSPDLTQSCSRRHSCKTTEDGSSSASREAATYKQKLDVLYKSTSYASLQKALNGNSSHQGDSLPQRNGIGFNTKPSPGQFVESGSSTPSHDNAVAGNVVLRCVSSEKLENIWAQCIEKCHSKTLRQLLHSHGKLVSISETEGVLVAYVAFVDGNIKSRAERFVSSITNSMEMVLRRNVEVRIVHLSGGEASLNSPSPIHLPGTAAIDRERRRVGSNATDGYSNCSLFLDGTRKSTSDSSDVIAEGNTRTNDTSERRQEIPMQRIESIIRDQRLETAWLQVADKGTPGSLSRLKPEKNQVLPQDGIYYEDQLESLNSMRLSSQQWADGVNHEVKILKVNSGGDVQKDQIGRKVDRYPMSPSLLHDSNFVANSNKDNLGDESGSSKGGCSGFFHCYKAKPRKRGKVKGTAVAVQPRKGRRFSLFGECGKKSRRTESRHTR